MPDSSVFDLWPPECSQTLEGLWLHGGQIDSLEPLMACTSLRKVGLVTTSMSAG
jgi:hypothetical protein